jgi:hypothetical protein
MTLENHKTILNRQDDCSWVAGIPGCYALMSTREAALAQLLEVFQMTAHEHRERATNSTEIVKA